MPSSFASISSVLHRLAHRLGLETKLVEFRLRQNWPDIAGPHLAAYTRPDQIRFKKLYLFVPNSVWAHQLTFLKPELIEKINHAAGDIVVSDIVLRVGEIEQGKGETPRLRSGQAAKGKSEEGSDQDVRSGADRLQEAAEHSRHVKDPELRAHLAGVIAKALSMRREAGGRTPVGSRPRTRSSYGSSAQRGP